MNYKNKTKRKGKNMKKQFINGQYVEGKGQVIDVTNPADGTVVGSFNAATKEQAEEALNVAQETFKTWKNTPVMERCDLLTKYADLVATNIDEISQLSSLETGKPYGEAYGDTQFALNVLRFNIEEAKRVYGVTIPDYNTKRGEVYNIIEKRPVGVVVGHLAWNYPMYNAALKIGPTIASGCCIVLKPSSQTPFATMLLGKFIKEAGIPDGVVNILAGNASELGYALNSSTIPRLIGLIGGTSTALEVMRDSATSIKRYSFELGGNAPTIVTPSADLKLAVSTIAGMKMGNSGQMCIDHNRIFVHKSIYKEFCNMMLEALSEYKLGQGADEGTIIGPLINKSAQRAMVDFVEDAVAAGAKLLLGGKIPADKPEGSCFFEPTLLVDCNKEMKVCKGEIFGPVAAIAEYDDFDATLAEAADTDGGLSSYLYSQNIKEIGKAIETFNSGEVLINVDGIGDVEFLPHVGIGNSGLGCDNSIWSLDEYFDLKRVKLMP